MKKIAIVALCAAALALGGCEQLAQFRETISTVAAVKVPRKEVVLAVDAYYAAEVTGTAYLRAYIRFPGKCDGVRYTQPFCRDPAVHRSVDSGIYAGRAAATRLRTFLRANPTDDGPSADYNALLAAADAIKNATAAWRAASPQ